MAINKNKKTIQNKNHLRFFIKWLKMNNLYHLWRYNIIVYHKSFNVPLNITLNSIINKQPQLNISYAFLYNRTKQGIDFWVEQTKKWTNYFNKENKRILK